MKLISRRTVLRGAGAVVALPLLEAMIPSRASACSSASAGAQSPAKLAPLRLLFLYVPNGVRMDEWTPANEGADFALPPILAPLAPHKSEILVLSGLTHDKARANGDGPGDHARACASFLTGAQPFKTDGASIKVGVSVDQVAAQAIGNRTRLRSLELGCESGAQSGQCDSGYACAYSSNLSWQTLHSPMAKEVDPRLVFERLFGDDGGGTREEREARARARKSILDFVRADARSLETKLGASDKRKLDEYLGGIRELERRIQRAGEDGVEGVAGSERPAGIPKDYSEHIRLMCDLLVLALRTDSTRIATFLLANEGSNRSYAFLGAPEGHHDISHHGNEAQKLDKLRLINRFHVEHLADLIGKLKAAPEGEGSLLDRSMIVYGSGISDGNRHNHEELPILLAGRGGGTISTGRHVRYPRDTPAANLYLELLSRMGVEVPALGDSTGRLTGLVS